MEDCERFFERGNHDGGDLGGVVIEMDGLEDGVAEEAADGVGDVGEEAADVGHESEAGGQDVVADG